MRFRAAVVAMLLTTVLGDLPASAQTCSDMGIGLADFGLNRDRNCNAYYKDTVPDLTLSSPPSELTTEYNPADAFKLHSRPESENIIYLDFDGFIWPSGTLWEGVWGLIFSGRQSPGYNSEGDAASFTDSELQNIIKMWESVSEDFAVFDVDVTTEEPVGERLQDFQAKGAWALILTDTELQKKCACGGSAQFDVFSTPNPRLHPSLNFSLFGDSVAPPWDVAEIVSHEVGHNVGLAHDGTSTEEYYGGHGMWTPIMGAGRGAGISTWSSGGYPDSKTRAPQYSEDDFATIARHVQLLADEEPSTADAAVDIAMVDLVGRTSGLIAEVGDQDWFAFTVPSGIQGNWGIELRPRGYAPNLDAELGLYQAAGTELAVANPLVPTFRQSGPIVSGLGAELSLDLEPGRYLLRVRGVGQGSLSDATGYSDYASRGIYTIVVTAPEPVIPPMVSGFSPRRAKAGARLSVTGSGLADATAVTIGGVRVSSFLRVTDTKLVLRVPKKAKSGKVKVVTPSGALLAPGRFVRLP